MMSHKLFANIIQLTPGISLQKKSPLADSRQKWVFHSFYGFRTVFEEKRELRELN